MVGSTYFMVKSHFICLFVYIYVWGVTFIWVTFKTFCSVHSYKQLAHKLIGSSLHLHPFQSPSYLFPIFLFFYLILVKTKIFCLFITNQLLILFYKTLIIMVCMLSHSLLWIAIKRSIANINWFGAYYQLMFN
jgi:hypothetical protein